MMRQVSYNCATTAIQTKILPRKSSLGIRLSTVDLLVLTGLYQLLHALKILFTFFTKLATLMRRSSVLSLPPQLAFPAVTLSCRIFAEKQGINYFRRLSSEQSPGRSPAVQRRFVLRLRRYLRPPDVRHRHLAGRLRRLKPKRRSPVS